MAGVRTRLLARLHLRWAWSGETRPALRTPGGLVRSLQRAVALQRLLQVAAQRPAVPGLLFEDGLLAQQVAVLALDVVAQRLAHRLGLQLQLGGLAQQAEQALAQVDQPQARGLERFLDQG